MANGNQKSESGWTSWALIVLLFATGIWPVALFLLFAKLFGNDNKQKRAAPPPLRTDAPYQAQGDAAGDTRRAAQSSRAKTAAKNMVKSPVAKKSNAIWLKIAGAVLAFAGAAAMFGPLGAIFYSTDWLRIWLPDLLEYLSLAVAGGAMFAGGLSMERSLRRYAQYLAVMGDEAAVDLGEMAQKLGWPEKRVEKDLQRMIDKGYFGGQAYLNMALGYFFRSSKADADLREETEKAEAAKDAAQPKEAEEGYSGILRNIRRANDRIADPALTGKIDRLEEIAARIFKAVEEDPKKAARIDTFLNYYLPTTQKLLDAYAEFDAAGVEGENLRQAKQRIEDTMDSIVAGFERQLDELYKADAMDVDSDIRVMETMLHRDGASVERDFGLGKRKPAAQPAREEFSAAEAAQPARAAEDVDLGGVAAQREE